MEIILFGCSKSRMCIGRANHTKLIGVNTNLALNLHTTNQRRTHKVANLRLVLSPVSLNVVRVIFKIGKRIVGRQNRMGLGIAFVLRHLNNRFPPPSDLRVLWANRLVTHCDRIEHGPF